MTDKHSESFARHQASVEGIGVGHIIEGEQFRDAIHVAVAPIEALNGLKPGQHVGIEDGKASIMPPHIGIVDPFLKDMVKPGQKFWLFLYPGSITSLRHQWTHPAFGPEHSGKELSAEEIRKKQSEEWIKTYADSIGLAYHVLMQGAESHIMYDDYLVFGGLLEGVSTPIEFWDHFEIVTGKEVPGKSRNNFFSCSC